MHANEVDTREKWKLPAIKTINYNIYMNDGRLFKHCSLYCGYIMLLSIKNISTCLIGSSSTANSPWPTGANQIWKMQVIYHRRYIWSETRLRGQQTIDQHHSRRGRVAVYGASEMKKKMAFRAIQRRNSKNTQNTLPYGFYLLLRSTLQKKKKQRSKQKPLTVFMSIDRDKK